MLGRFVGRKSELREITQVLEAAEVLWITGPAGIGKSRLALEAAGGRKALYLDGHFMSTPAEALPYLGEIFGASLEAACTENGAVRISSSLAALAAHTEVLIVEDAHLVARSLANLLLRVFRRTPLGIPVLVIGRESWSTSELVGDRLHHLPLHELGEDDTRLFARACGREAEELPQAAIGHPLLMQLFFRDGATRIDEWTDSLLGELEPHRALLTRLIVAHSPVQLRWAMQGFAEAQLEVLHEKGIFQRRRGTFPPVEDGLRRLLEESGQREELERELLAYLASRPILVERDLARALQLAVRYAEDTTLASLLERHAAASTLVQPALVSVLRNRGVPARAKLDGFHALAELITLISAEDFLQVHDALIGSEDVLERRVAQISFLRAAFISGHRQWPPEAAIYLRELLGCPLLPFAVKEQILHLSAFRAVHTLRRTEELWQMLELLGQEGLDAKALRAYRLLFAGVELAYQYRLPEAVRSLRESASAFAACELQLHVEWIQRYLLGLCYSSGQLAEFRALLAQLDGSAREHFRIDFRYRFWKTVDAWNHGESEPLERECARAALAVPPHLPALLPGPYLLDGQPSCFRVILDRARDAPIDPAVVELFVHLLERMMMTIPVTLASICLAQHLWLAGEEASLARVRAALQGLGPVGQAHAALLGCFQDLEREPAGVEPILGLVDRAWLLREPLTAPYYVVMAARLAHEAGLPAATLAARMREHPKLAGMPIRTSWLIEAAALALGAEARAAVTPPEEVRRAVAAQVQGPRKLTPRPGLETDTPVKALKELIDSQWFEEVRLESFARAHNLSRFAISRRFKTLLGKSPRQYLQETRLNQAKRKLLETDWTVTDIAFECGFADAAQFSRLFKEATGMPPVRYRESNRIQEGAPGSSSKP